MRCHDLTVEQAEALYKRLGPMSGYLHQLETRMTHQGFPNDDELFLLVKLAKAAMQHLSVECHYLSCRSGVGKPPRIHNPTDEK